MKLSTLIDGLDIKRIAGDIEIEINGLAQNSKLVKPGDLFVSIEGFVVDGHEYISEAISKGAKAIVVQKDISLNQDCLLYTSTYCIHALFSVKYKSAGNRKTTCQGKIFCLDCT